MLHYLRPVVFALLTSPAFSALPPTVPEDCTFEPVCDGLDAAITMDVAKDGRVFITEQLGAVRVVQSGKLLPEPFLRLEVDDKMERGVEGVALHPRFPEVPWVYVHYVRKVPHPHHVVSRFTAQGPDFNTAVAGSELVMALGDDQDKTAGKTLGVHQGGAIRFGADGKLYVTIGEHSAREPSQSMESLLGKLLRFNDDGTPSEDNPFYKTTTGAYRAIYATGLRNPFGLAVQPETGRMWVTDVGQELFEEINEVKAGANYGWPKAEGLIGHASSFTAPIHSYNRALGTCIAGGVFVPAKSALPARFAGKFLFVDFMAHWIRSVDPADPTTSEPFAARMQSPVDLAMAPDGSLLVLARNAGLQDGKLKRNTGMLIRIKAK